MQRLTNAWVVPQSQDAPSVAPDIEHIWHPYRRLTASTGARKKVTYVGFDIIFYNLWYSFITK